MMFYFVPNEFPFYHNIYSFNDFRNYPISYYFCYSFKA
jgi:hypothetical protein